MNKDICLYFIAVEKRSILGFDIFIINSMKLHTCYFCAIMPRSSVIHKLQDNERLLMFISKLSGGRICTNAPNP